jgi:hypothetical protein
MRAVYAVARGRRGTPIAMKQPMNSVIYIVGLVVVVIAVLSFFGLG